jgi:hypothetical protein
MSYADALQNPIWQKKRLEIFNRDNWKCRRCLDTQTMLHVHHLYYTADVHPWEYPNEAFLTLCKVCHAKVEFYKWLSRGGLNTLRELGFLKSDIESIHEIVFSRVDRNGHYESLVRYIDDIKRLCHG